MLFSEEAAKSQAGEAVGPVALTNEGETAASGIGMRRRLALKWHLWGAKAAL